MKKILLSGVKPTGNVHIGNYFGAMRQFVDYQSEYDSLIFIANYHALTSVSDGELLRKLSLDVAMDYLAIGLDPKKSTIFLQSDVPQVTELAWIFNTLTTVPYLSRAHAYKDKINKEVDSHIKREKPTEDEARFLREYAGFPVILLLNLLLPGKNADGLRKNLTEEYHLTPERVQRLADALIVIKETTEVNVGLFDYPILMAADILVYGADVVPVGLDQKQHIEIARDTAQKFNRAFGETFKTPEPLIVEDVKTVMGTDGRKMSKSYGNTIGLFAEDDEIKKAVMSIPTDSKGVDEPKDPKTCKVFAFHELVSGNDLEDIRSRYLAGGIGYKESKEILIKNLTAFIAPFREKRKRIAEDPDAVLRMLKEGGEAAKAIADKKMKEIREKVGLELK